MFAKIRGRENLKLADLILNRFIYKIRGGYSGPIVFYEYLSTKLHNIGNYTHFKEIILFGLPPVTKSSYCFLFLFLEFVSVLPSCSVEDSAQRTPSLAATTASTRKEEYVSREPHNILHKPELYSKNLPAFSLLQTTLLFSLFFLFLHLFFVILTGWKFALFRHFPAVFGLDPSSSFRNSKVWSTSSNVLVDKSSVWKRSEVTTTKSHVPFWERFISIVSSGSSVIKFLKFNFVEQTFFISVLFIFEGTGTPVMNYHYLDGSSNINYQLYSSFKVSFFIKTQTLPSCIYLPKIKTDILQKNFLTNQLEFFVYVSTILTKNSFQKHELM